MTTRKYRNNDFNTGGRTTGGYACFAISASHLHSSVTSTHPVFCAWPQGQALRIIKQAVNQRQIKHCDKNPCTVRNSGWDTPSVNKLAGRRKVAS